MTMSPFDALQAWQSGKISEAEAMALSGADDGWTMWEWALDWNVEIKLGDRDRIRDSITRKRQIEAGQWDDLDDVIADIDRMISRTGNRE